MAAAVSRLSPGEHDDSNSQALQVAHGSGRGGLNGIGYGNASCIFAVDGYGKIGAAGDVSS